jgi:hypothetical protein
MASIRHKFRVLEEGALGHLERRRRPHLLACGHLLVRNANLDGVLDGVDGDDVSILDEGDRAADLSFRYDMTDAEAVRAFRCRLAQAEHK